MMELNVTHRLVLYPCVLGSSANFDINSLLKYPRYTDTPFIRQYLCSQLDREIPVDTDNIIGRLEKVSYVKPIVDIKDENIVLKNGKATAAAATETELLVLL